MPHMAQNWIILALTGSDITPPADPGPSIWLGSMV